MAKRPGELPALDFDVRADRLLKDIDAAVRRRDRRRDMKAVGIILLIAALTCGCAVLLALSIGANA